MRNPDEWYPANPPSCVPGQFPKHTKARLRKVGKRVSRALQAKNGLKKLEELGLLKRKP